MTESTEENQESPIKPTVQDEGIGALTSALLREHVKRPSAKFFSTG